MNRLLHLNRDFTLITNKAIPFFFKNWQLEATMKRKANDKYKRKLRISTSVETT